MSLLSPLTLPWDLVIFFVLAVSGSLTAVGLLHWKRGRLWLIVTWFIRLLTLTTGLIFAVVFYGSFIEPQLITVTRHTIPMAMGRPVTIAVISDLHVGPYKGAGYVTRVVNAINALQPDIVIIAGDFVLEDDVTSDSLTPLQPLHNLHARYGVFAILGNHDHGIFRAFGGKPHERVDKSKDVTAVLEKLNITVLRNSSSKLSIDGSPLTVAGVEDVWSGKTDIERTLRGTEHPVILVAHNPDIILDPLASTADLVLAGHTHGGQIRLPWYGPLAILPTRIGQKYDQGIFPLKDGHTLAITRGIGESGPRARLFAPPEILLLETRNDQSGSKK